MTTPAEFDAETNQALLTVCLFAAFANGNLDESERMAIRRLAEELGSEDGDGTDSLTSEILMGKRSWETVVAGLRDHKARLLAYDMARSTCEADGASSPEENHFLDELRIRLELSGPEVATVSAAGDAAALATVPAGSGPLTPAPDSTNEELIMRSAIINGALEILPGTLATMAIIPLQMKLVYDIAKSHGVELGTANAKDFLATLGAGLTSQVVEGFARKLLGGIGKTLGGRFAGGLASQAAGSAMSFTSTYAIGHVADRYYAGGQKLGMAEIQSLMSELTQRAKDLYSSKLPEIQESAKNLKPAALLDLVKGKSSAL